MLMNNNIMYGRLESITWLAGMRMWRKVTRDRRMSLFLATVESDVLITSMN